MLFYTGVSEPSHSGVDPAINVYWRLTIPYQWNIPVCLIGSLVMDLDGLSSLILGGSRPSEHLTNSSLRAQS